MGPTAIKSIDAFTDQYLYKLIFKAEPPTQTTVGGDGGKEKDLLLISLRKSGKYCVP